MIKQEQSFDEADMGNCEECGNSVPDIDLTNIMVSEPMEIIAVCSVCLAKLEDEA